MYSKVRSSLAAVALAACWGCGSSSDLIIGSQIEAGLVAQEGGHEDQDAQAADRADQESEPDVQDSGHIVVCGDGAIRPTDARAPTDGAGREGGSTIIDAMVDDAGCANPALCTTLKSALVHRYSFSGTGTTVIDSVGSANGTVVNAQLSGDGSLKLAGASTDQYVDLPNGIIKSLTNATFEAWVNWNGCGGWERIFDFGDAGGGDNGRGTAWTTLYLTPESQNGRDVMFGAFKRVDQDALYETRAASNLPLPAGVVVHVALVVDDANNLMTLYEDGAFEGSVAYSDSLSMLNDVNVWLGRSQYTVDPSFGGTFHEFRIYNVALSAAAIQTSFVGGPNAPFLD
jgi:hypothetical protein